MYIKKTALAMAIAVVVIFMLSSVAFSASSLVLLKECEGSEVKALQEDLKRLGYFDTEPTGYYGDITEAAVRKIQKDYGYATDGIAGEITLSLVDRLLGRGSVLKNGDENNSVRILQERLIKLGYLNTKATGYYGPATEAAVKKLQTKYGCTTDGITGSETQALIERLIKGDSVAASQKVDNSSSTTKQSSESGKAINQSDYLLKWYGNVEKVFARGDNATVYDIKTGKSFNIKRTYGHNHADCETLATEDTAIMKEIYSGKWSWERRAVIVIVGDTRIAACMTGFPHAGMDKYAANKTITSRSGGYGKGTNLDTVKKNKMDGVFDIHFLGSKNHYNNKIDPKHQALVKEAAKWAEENYGKEKDDK